MSRKIVCRVVLLFAASVVCMPGAVRAQDYDAYYISGYDHKPSARMEMGVSLAATYMGISGGGELSLAPRLGVRGALVMSLCWSERYALQVELAYLFNKIRAERAADGGGVTGGHDVRSNVMEIPLLFSLRGLGPLRLNVGPVLSLAGTGRYDSGTERI